ncbi:YdcF family protein [Thalassorhabdus alkalitolerans]|uniref:YdcF family protein n=1 Tax=Thalassorhabdus alkalitolerans TaxID=2282697 RepID=A0ABW0YLT4_9BACI
MRLGCTIGVLLTFLFFVYLTIIALLPRSILTDLLLYEDEPVKSDVIIVLSGDQDRLEKAEHLYSDGYGAKVLISNALDGSMTPEAAREFGIAADDIIVEDEAGSTYENAEYTKEIVEEKGFSSAMVVTSDYHMRRTKVVFDRVYGDTGVRLTYVPYYHEYDDWSKRDNELAWEYYKWIGSLVAVW